MLGLQVPSLPRYGERAPGGPAPGGGEGARTRPSWLVSALALILIFTIVVDVLGNLLVILSVYRNKKLRNAGRGSRDLAAWTGSLQL
uniref:Uncharacterized protein n=1 Tax=Sus scrofa TaxID=9823 RepID=A0A8D0YCL1_PIG